MRIMVLGANGYLGKKIISFLTELHCVTAVYRKVPERIENIKVIGADLNSIQKTLQEESFDWIINCVAVYEHADTRINEITEANIIFSLRVLNCAVECGVKKFLTIDTGLPKELNLYSFTKKQFAEFGRFYAKKYEITFLNILLEMFYGEDEPEGRFLSGSCRKMVRGEDLNLTAGTQKRDVIYIDDVCKAILLLVHSSLSGFWNIPLGCGQAIEIRKIIEYMHMLTQTASILHFGNIPLREKEPDCVADITLLRSIGFEPHYTWREGIEHLCKKIMEDNNNSMLIPVHSAEEPSVLH